MAIEPVNERPIFPSLTRLDALGVSHWSTSMIRQLTTVFQQYGYKLNQSLMGEDLTQNDGTVPEVDQNSVWTAEQVFWSTGGGSGSANAFRMYNETADVAWIFRKDQSSLFLLRSDTDETGSNWDSSRPMRVDDITGGIEFGITGVTEGVTVGEPSGGTRGKGSLSAETVNCDGLLTVTRSLADGERAIHLNLHRAWEIKRNGGTASSASLFIDSRANNPMQFGSENGNPQWLWLSNTGCLVGSPSGGTQGHGTLNAVAVYDDGTLLTDYVFDAELDGRIDAHAYDKSTEEDELDDDGKVVGKRRRTHKPAWAFAANMNECDPKAYTAKWRQSRKLPAVERAADKPSIGELAQALLETCEVQAIHIAKLEERISALEANNGSSTPKKPRSPTDSRD